MARILLLLTSLLLADIAVGGRAGADPGMSGGGECIGPRGLQEACPGEQVNCRVVVTAIDDTLSLIQAKVVSQPASGPQTAEFIAPLDGGIIFTSPDSATFALIISVDEGDRGTRVEGRVSWRVEVLEPYNTCCGTGDFGMFYDVPTDCPPSLFASAKKVAQPASCTDLFKTRCKKPTLNRKTGKLTYKRCVL